MRTYGHITEQIYVSLDILAVFSSCDFLHSIDIIHSWNQVVPVFASSQISVPKHYLIFEDREGGTGKTST